MNRHEGSFVDAYRELLPKAYRVAFRLLGERTAAEDVAAEALGRAWARWSRVSTLPYRDAWVLRVTSNLALTQLGRRHPPVSTTEHVDGADSGVAERLALIDALRELPRRQRQVVVLRHFGGLSEAEVAASLHIRPGTVKTHVQRALETLRARLGNEATERSIAC